MLARAYPVDAALGEARRAIFAHNNELEWGTPVLYMRSTDGRIFDVAPGAAGAASRRLSPRPTGAEVDPIQAQRAAQPRTPATSQTPAEVRQPARQAQAQRLAPIYTQALAAFYAEQWEQAIGLLTEIVSERPDYEDAATKLEDAIRQRTVSEHYAAAIRGRESQDWAAAVEHLESLMALDPGYRDANALLDEAQRQRVLAELYSKARGLYQAGQWRATVDTFEHISDLDAAYPDPDGLLASAQKNLEAVGRERRLATLYGAGLRHMDNGLWTEAIACFEQIQQMAPDYEATSSLLARARASSKEADEQVARSQVARSIESRPAEAQRQQRLADLFTEGRTHFRANRWGDAIRALRELVALDPAYADPTGGSAADLLTAALHQRELTALPSPPGERTNKPRPKDLPR
jgi:outer membrane protein assembly factor BamD (BamD/ComL family)